MVIIFSAVGLAAVSKYLDFVLSSMPAIFIILAIAGLITSRHK
ncbi:MAG: mercury resistance system transport protein MerF [Moritella sp.]|nr:mercury resistance system transport protein MerF [Moritella sp.]MDX2322113.1 mercury resistance system transport protein MerF [Moritella sp.]